MGAAADPPIAAPLTVIGGGGGGVHAPPSTLSSSNARAAASSSPLLVSKSASVPSPGKKPCAAAGDAAGVASAESTSGLWSGERAAGVGGDGGTGSVSAEGGEALSLRPQSPRAGCTCREGAPSRGDRCPAAVARRRRREWRAFRAGLRRGSSGGDRMSSSGGTSNTGRPLPDPTKTVKDRTLLMAKMPSMRPYWAARREVVPEPTNWTHRSYMSEE